MADTVRYLLEESIPELEDLEQRGYFSRAEIKSIVRKREEFEYLLKRRAALKQDFYRYIDYESKLEELRLMRKQKLGIKGKKSLSEVSITRRIHFIYERAARKFKADLDLWVRWIEHCKKLKSTKRLSKVVTKALQRHATTALLWIEAACWEFEHNANIAAARSLMQQGIRMCKHDESIWVEYFRLELLYVHKLRARRAVLGLDSAEADGQGAVSDEEDAGAGSGAPAAAVKAVLSGAVAAVVFKSAVAALPGSLGFRVKFLRVLAQFSFEGVDALRQQVVSSIRADFKQAPEAYDVLAREELRRNSGASATSSTPQQQQQQPAPAGSDAAHAAACRVFEEGVHSAAQPAERVYELYVGYLCEALESALASPDALQAAVAAAAQLFQVLQAAHAAGRASPALYITWVDWAEKVEQPKMALKAARRACERHPSSALLWRRRLQLELGLHGARSHSAQELFATLAQGLRSTQAQAQQAGAADLWLMAVSALHAGSPEFRSLCGMLEEASAQLAAKQPSGGLGHVAAGAVQKMRDEVGLDEARQLYQRLLRVPGAGGDLYRCALQIEREAYDAAVAAATASSSSSTAASALQRERARISGLFDAAVAAYGSTEADLWLEYARWAVACGQGGGAVYWRATKELSSPDDFIQRYREVVQQEAP